MKKLLVILCLSTVSFGFSQTLVEFAEKSKGYFMEMQTESLRDSILNMMRLPVVDSVDARKFKFLMRDMYNLWDRIVFRSDGTADYTAYQKAYNSFLQSELFCDNDSTPEWQLLGPTGNVGNKHNQGLISAISVNPNDLNEIVIGSYGGIHKTTNGGTNWTCVTNDLPYPVFAIQDIIRLDSLGLKMVAASGSKFIMNNGIGTLYSSDGGTTWELSTGLEEVGVYPIINYIDSDDTYVYAGTDTKIFRSSDDGETWVLFKELPVGIINDFHFFGEFKINDVGDIIVVTRPEYTPNTQLLFYDASENEWFDITEQVTSNPLFRVTLNFPIETTQAGFVNRYLYLTQTTTGLDYPHYDGNGSAPHGYENRCIIRTGGWGTETSPIDNNVELLSCDLSSTINNKEVITTRNMTVPYSVPETVGQIITNYYIPKGVNFKVCVLESVASSGQTDYYNNLMDSSDYDELWSYTVYESGFSTENQWVNYIGNVPEIELLSGKTFNDHLSFASHVFILETNSEYVGGTFLLENFGAISNRLFSIRLSKYTNIASVSKYSGYYEYFTFDDSFQNFDFLYRDQSHMNLTYNKNDWRSYFVTSKSNSSENFYVGAVGLDMYDYNISDMINLEPHLSSHVTDTWHCDVRSMQPIIDPTDGKEYLFIGNDGGLSKCEIDSTGIHEWETLNGDLSISLYYNMAVNYKNGEICGALQDNSFFKSDENENWTHVAAGDGINAYFDWQEGFLLYADQYGFKKSPTGTSDWIDFHDSDYDGFLDNPAKGYKYNSDVIYVGGQFGKLVKYERNNPKTIFTLQEVEKEISAIGLCEMSRDTIYVASFSDSVRFLRSDDGGLTFESLTDSPVAIAGESPKRLDEIVSRWGHRIRDIAVDDKTARRLWVTVNGIYGQGSGVNTHEREKVLMSEDFGESFVDYSQGLPNLPIQCIIYVDGYNDLLFLGSDAGVYYRDASMSKWECYSHNLPFTSVTSLAYDYCSKELYCSTWGRGIFKVKVDAKPDFAGSSRIIETTQTYSGDEYCFQDIRIPSGKTLTVTGTLHMGADRTIHIEPGGKLVVDGGTITNSCGARWQGIQVYGQSNLFQTNTNQGVLETKNDAVIEFADQAVEVWKKDVWNTTGGIVKLENTTFRNNGKSVAFFPYANIFLSSGVEWNNISSISKCNFIVDNDFVGNPPVTQVTLFKVKGVSIQQSHFEDERTGLLPKARLSGIRSLDATFKVLGSCPLGQTCTTDYYDETKIEPTTFKNLSFGVHAQNAQTMSQATIDRCYFENVYDGIIIDAMDNAIVSRNLFDNSIYRAKNIVTQGATSYKIEGNTFRGYYLADKVSAVQVHHSGPESNQVFRNRYETVSIGNTSVGLNRDLMIQDPAVNKGLQFLCNTYEDNDVDQLATAVMIPVQGEGMQDWQGTNEVSAGNTYDGTEHKSIINAAENQSTFRYFYFENNANEEPINSAEIVKLFSDNERECSNTFSLIIVRPTKPILGDKRPGVVNELDSIIGVISVKTAYLDSLLRVGDSTYYYQIIDEMTSQNAATNFQKLSLASPYLSDSIMYLLADLDARDFSESYLRDICILNPEKSNRSEYLDYLENKTSPLPQNMIDSILNSPEFSDLSFKRAEIRQLHEQKEVLSTLLLQDYFTDSIYPSLGALDSAVIQRGHTMLPLELVQTAIWKNDRSATLQAISNASDWLDTADLHILYEMVIADYLDFQADLLDLTSGVYLEGVDSTAGAMLRDYAENAIGYAQFQAENYLCFFLDECDILDYEYIVPKGMLHGDLSEEEEWIEIIHEGNTVSLYPNPATDEVTLDFGEEAEKALFVVFNIQGQLVTSGRTQDAITHKISIADWQPGLYLIRVRVNNNKNETLRLIVK